MPAISLGGGAYRRERGDLPEFLRVNMFLEATPSAEAGAALLDRPPLESHLVPGNVDEVRAVFSQPGTYSGDIFSVIGNKFYRQSTELTTIAGTGPVSIAASATEVLVTAGTTLYSYNGTNTQAVVLPDTFSARAVTIISSTFVVSRAGSDRFYWSALLDGRTFDALDYATAESEPDYLLDVVTMRGNLYLMGQSSIEPWYYSGAVDLPFALIQQRLIPKGTIATGCAVEMDNTLIWVGSDGVVYRLSEVPERISDHGIEERIAESPTVSAFGFVWEGHSFFFVRLDTGTFPHDAATGQWAEWKSYGRDNFRGRCATVRAQTVLIGDDEDGIIWTLGEDFTDEETVVREFTGAFPIKGGSRSVDSVALEANSGRTQLLTGLGSDPVIEMAVSRDQGATWSAYRSARLGVQGEYRVGMFDSPGGMLKFRTTAPARLRITNAVVNEPGGGRSRGT
jgi:hypothetical protein